MTIQTVSLPASIMSQIERDNVSIDITANQCELEEGNRQQTVRQNNRHFMHLLMKERGIVK